MFKIHFSNYSVVGSMKAGILSGTCYEPNHGKSHAIDPVFIFHSSCHLNQSWSNTEIFWNSVALTKILKMNRKKIVPRRKKIFWIWNMLTQRQRPVIQVMVWFGDMNLRADLRQDTQTRMKDKGVKGSRWKLKTMAQTESFRSKSRKRGTRDNCLVVGNTVLGYGN